MKLLPIIALVLIATLLDRCPESLANKPKPIGHKYPNSIGNHGRHVKGNGKPIWIHGGQGRLVKNGHVVKRCPLGQALVRGKCKGINMCKGIIKHVSGCKCPNGHSRTSNGCVKGNHCKGLKFGNRCVQKCPRGMIKSGKKCVKKKCQGLKMSKGCPKKCSRDLVRSGKKCVNRNKCTGLHPKKGCKKKCPNGKLISGNKCIKKYECKALQTSVACVKKCPNGLVKSGKRCIKKNKCNGPKGCGKKCQKGQLKSGKKCIARKDCKGLISSNSCVRKCPNGQVQSGKTCTGKRPCATGYVRVNKKCLKKCQNGQKRAAGECTTTNEDSYNPVHVSDGSGFTAIGTETDNDDSDQTAFSNEDEAINDYGSQENGVLSIKDNIKQTIMGHVKNLSVSKTLDTGMKILQTAAKAKCIVDNLSGKKTDACGGTQDSSLISNDDIGFGHNRG